MFSLIGALRTDNDDTVGKNIPVRAFNARTQS